MGRCRGAVDCLGRRLYNVNAVYRIWCYIAVIIMGIIKKLVRHGNSWALIIDKPLMQVLDWTEDTELEITTDGVSIKVTAVRDKATPKG